MAYEIDQWIGSYKVRAFPWVDGKNIYVNVQYYKPGQSIQKPPAWEKTAYIVDDAACRKFVYEYTETLVNAFNNGNITNGSKIKVG